jgi:hypothetical protein
MKKTKRNVDPDEGLEIRKEVIQRLIENKASGEPSVTMEEVAKKYGIELNKNGD